MKGSCSNTRTVSVTCERRSRAILRHSSPCLLSTNSVSRWRTILLIRRVFFAGHKSSCAFLSFDNLITGHLLRSFRTPIRSTFFPLSSREIKPFMRLDWIFGHSLTGEKFFAQGKLCISITLERRTPEPVCGLAVILFHSSTIPVVCSQKSLGNRVATFGGCPNPFDRFRIILSNAFTGKKHFAHRALRDIQALLGGISKPFYGFRRILRNPVAGSIHDPQCGLSLGIPFSGRPSVPNGCLFKILLDAKTRSIHRRQLLLCVGFIV